MTAPERLSDTAPWRDWFEKAMNSGAPIVDNAVDPDAIGAYGLEWDGDRCQDCRRPVDDDVKLCDDCDGQCPECGREVTQPGLCFDCDVRSSYVGGLAPRFGAQP